MTCRRLGAITLAAAMAAPAVAAADPVQISLWHRMGDQQGRALDDLVAQFHATQDDYRIELTYRGDYDDIINGAIAAYRAGEHPHVIQTNEVTSLTLMVSGAIMPVQELMGERGYDVDWSQYIQPLVQWYMTGDGELLSMPFNTSSPLLYWNKEMFEAAGLDPDTPPETWDEFEEVARTITEQGMCGYAMWGHAWPVVESYSLTHDIPIATRNNGFDGLDAELTIHETRLVDHLERLKGMLDEGTAVFGGEGAVNMFVGGECAMVIRSASNLSFIERDSGFDFGTAFLPHEADVEPKNSIIGGATLWALDGHGDEEYDAVAAFFNYIAQTETQIAWHKATGYVPVTVAAYEQLKAEGYFDEHPHRETSILQLMRPTTELSRGYRLGNFTEVRSVIMEEMEAIWSGEKSAKDAMTEAAERGDRVLRRFEQIHGS